MSHPILVTPAAKPPQAKPSTPAAPSDKTAFSQALGVAERRAETSKPKPGEPEAAPAEDTRAETPPEPDPLTSQAGQAPADGPVAQVPVDLQIMVAVSNPPGLPVVQANAQPAAPLAVEADAAAPSPTQATAPTPIQLALAPAVPVAQQATAEQVKALGAAGKAQEAVPPQGAAATSPVDGQAAIAPSVQPETGEEQGASDESDSPPQKGPKPPVMPVASQHVSQSVESLRAAEKVATLVTGSREAAPVAQGPEAHAVRPAPEAAALVAEAVSTSDAAQPAQEAVRPWQLPHAVGAGEAQAPQAQLIEDGAPSGEAMPMREAMRMPFTQAAKEPGKPSELRLQLSPEHLGRMEIRVMSHEGVMSAQIRVDHSQAREMMQVQLAELRQSLADQGIKIDRLEVNVGQDQRRGEASFASGGNLQQQAGQQQQQAHQTASGRVSYYGDEAFDEGDDEAAGLPLAGVGATAVDYQA